ncbi:MAG: Uma2 family endonuclease [Arcicella sp.]|nr:Uma2 family endonuclease [Arcicella sp.]
MVITLERPKRGRRIPAVISPKNIPESLVYEMIDGKILYRKGYKQVLAGKKTLEEIMGASSLQSIVAFHISSIIAKFIDEDIYFVLINEAGINLDHKNNLANDLAIYDQAVLKPSMISTKYTDVPPKIAIEIDVKAEYEDWTELGYIYKKIQKLLNFGVEKVIWIITSVGKVTVSTQEKNWETMDWNKDVEIMDGHSFNVADYLIKRGVEY